MWCWQIASKSDAPKALLNIIDQIQKLLNVKIQTLQTDGGAEFNNHALKTELLQRSISYRTSARNSPQSNGAVERRNRTLLNVGKAMLTEARLDFGKQI